VREELEADLAPIDRTAGHVDARKIG
jgi:hypothetical protein